MKKFILIFILFSCAIFPSLAQNTPIKLVKKARFLVKDSADLVKSRKDLIQETKALIKEIQNLGKKPKIKKNTKYQIGLTFQPFNFKNYESQEGISGTKLIKPKIFNGFALGLTFRKKLSEHFSLRTEITYATQSEKFSSSNYTIIDANGGDNIYVYNSEDKLKYNIARLPLLIDYNFKLGVSTWSVHGYTGFQLGYLNSYIRSGLSYDVNRDGDSFIINRDVLDSELYLKNGKGYAKLFDTYNPDPDAYLVSIPIDQPKDAVFRVWSLAIVSGIEIEKRINSKFSIGFGLRYQYNLTETESNKYERERPIIYNVYSTDNGSASNQKRIGMTFSLIKTIH